MTEGGHLGGVVQDDGDDGRVVVAIDNEAKTLKSETEVTRVEGNTLETLLTLAGAQLAGNQLERGKNLHEDARGRRLAILSRGVGGLELVNDVLLSSNVTTVGTERLGEGSHKHIDFRGVDTKVIADTTTAGAKGTDGVSLVDKQVELVLAFELQKSGQITHGTLHRVETLDNDQNLLPRAVSAGLSLRDSLAKNSFQIGHVVVLEGLDDSARQTSTHADGGVVQLVGDDQGTLGDQSRERAGVGDVAHGEQHSSRLANKGGNLTLDLKGKVRGSHIAAGAAEGNSVALDALLDGVGTGTVGLSKAEVVVGAHVEGFSVGTRVLVRLVEVIGLAVNESDVSARNTNCGTREAVIKTLLQSAGVKAVEITVEGSVAIVNHERLVFLGVAESLAEEVTDVAEDDEEEVADVGGQEVVVGRLVLNGSLEGLAMRLADVTMTGVRQGRELRLGTSFALSVLGRKRLEEGGVGVDGAQLASGGGGEGDAGQRDGRRDGIGVVLLHGEHGLSSGLVLGLGTRREELGQAVALGGGRSSLPSLVGLGHGGGI